MSRYAIRSIIVSGLLGDISAFFIARTGARPQAATIALISTTVITVGWEVLYSN